MNFTGLFFAFLLSTSVVAQDFPARPVRVIVPFPPGGGADALARLLGPKLADLWGQQVIVENKPGASGHLGADLVAQAPADGYTLLMSSTASLTEKNVDRFAPVSLVSAAAYIVTAHPRVAAASIGELIALARAMSSPMFAAATRGWAVTMYAAAETSDTGANRSTFFSVSEAVELMSSV